MTTFQKLKHEARRAEQRSDWARAIDLYQRALDTDEDMADLSLYNRIGDLYLRLGRNEAAVESYEHAVERYADNGMHTSAIALCNKILRIAPARVSTYRRLGGLHARTGLVAEGRSSLLTYVKQVLEEDGVGDAASAVDEFFELTGDEDARIRFADLLAEHGHGSTAAEQLRVVYRQRHARGEDATGLRERIEALDPPEGSVDEGESDGVGASAGPDEPRGAPVRLAELVVSRLEARGGGSSYDAASPRPEASDSSPADGLEGVRRNLGSFREQLDDALQTAGPEVRYDLGVEFMTIGLLDEAIREFQTAVTDSSLVEAANARIGECLALRSSGASFDAIRRASRRPATGASAGAAPAAAPVDAAEPGDAAEPMEAAEHMEAAERMEAAEPLEGGEADDSAATFASPEPVEDERSAEPARPDAPEAEAEPAPDGAEPRPDAEEEDELQGQFFRARLAQYRIRRAEERHMTDHAAHLDLGAAYIEMELHQEALRELGVALEGPRPVSGRAVRALNRLALGPSIAPELALEVIEGLAAAGAGPAAEALGTQLSGAWPPDHPMRERLVDLRSRLWSGVDELPALEDMFPAMADIDPAVETDEPAAEADDSVVEADQPVAEADDSAVEADDSAAEADEPAAEADRRPAREPAPDEPAAEKSGPAAHDGSAPDASDIADAARDDGAAGPAREHTVERVLSSAAELVEAGDAEGAAERLHASFVRLEEGRRTSEALTVLDRLLELQPDDATLHHQHAELALMTNDRDRLLSAQVGLGACLRRLGAAKRARTVYGRILDVDPSNEIARQAIAEIDGAELEREREQQIEHESSREDAEGSLTEEDAAEVDALIQGLAGLEEDGAGIPIDVIDGVDDGGPDDATAQSRYELGLAFRQMGMWDEATRELRPALDRVVDRLGVLEALGECLVKAGRPSEAVHLLRPNLRADEDTEQVAPLYFLGLALQADGEEAEAREVFGRVEAARPGYRDAADRLSELSL